jgi:hypothetical protein
MAKRMQEMLLPTMAAYADLGRSLHLGMLRKPKRGVRKGKPTRKR